MLFVGLNAAVGARLAQGLSSSADGVARPEALDVAGPSSSATDGAQLLPALDGTRVTGLDGTRVTGLEGTRVTGLEGTRVTGTEGIRVTADDGSWGATAGTRVTGVTSDSGAAAPNNGAVLLPGHDAAPWPTPVDGDVWLDEPVYVLPAFDDAAAYEPPFTLAFSHYASGDFVFGM